MLHTAEWPQCTKQQPDGIFVCCFLFATCAPCPSSASHCPTPLPPAVSPPPRFSKALVAAAADQPDYGQQNMLTLTFRSPRMEQEYGQWIGRFHLKVDMLFSLLLALSLLIISFVSWGPGSKSAAGVCLLRCRAACLPVNAPGLHSHDGECLAPCSLHRTPSHRHCPAISNNPC